MQKVKKAAAQLDSRAAISVLNNLKNNQIVVENYEIFCELYEKAIVCKDYSLAPLFSDGSLIVKQKINDDCIDLIINFSVNFTEKGSILANLECLRLDFFAQNGFNEDNTAPTIKAIENRQQQFKYIGKIKIEYSLDFDNIIEWENSLISVLARHGYANPIEYLNAQSDVEEIRANLKACIDLFKGVLICADYLLKHPEETRKAITDIFKYTANFGTCDDILSLISGKEYRRTAFNNYLNHKNYISPIIKVCYR